MTPSWGPQHNQQFVGQNSLQGGTFWKSVGPDLAHFGGIHYASGPIYYNTPMGYAFCNHSFRVLFYYFVSLSLP